MTGTLAPFLAMYAASKVGVKEVLTDIASGPQIYSLVSPYTCRNVSLSRGPGRKHGASFYTRKRLSPGSIASHVTVVLH
jgi:hypothetical protein